MQIEAYEKRRTVAQTWRALGSLRLIDTVFNHLSCAWHGDDQKLYFTMTPEGLLPHEVKARDLSVLPIRAYAVGEAAGLGLNADGLEMHSTLHSLRARSGFIVHTHSVYSVAVGCTVQGLLPISQTSIEFVESLVMLNYEGLFREAAEKNIEYARLARTGGVALLRNHGTLIVADTAAEAIYLAYYIEEACRIQVLALSQNLPLVTPSREKISETAALMIGDRRKVASALFDALCRQDTRKDDGELC